MTLRHAFPRHLQQNGCPRAVISELRGDSPEGIIGVYREIGDEELRREYERRMPRILA
jgi:site-specific recombinase XerD